MAAITKKNTPTHVPPHAYMPLYTGDPTYCEYEGCNAFESAPVHRSTLPDLRRSDMATILENIQAGKYDTHLDGIIQACRYRKEARVYQLMAGDRVKFGPTVRPKYLAGAKATIINWRQSRVLIQLDESAYAGRFLRGGGRIIAHPQGLIPIDSDGKEVVSNG